MSLPHTIPKRFVGLDVHKHYLIATAVDIDLNILFGPQRVQLSGLEAWIAKTLTAEDDLVLEMTTNTWQIHDELLPHVHSVTVVHPPHVALIVRAQVMTDKIAAYQLARLLAKGLLVGIWVPPEEVRQRRALVAQRAKMVRLVNQAKNRLHSTLHRHHLALPEDGSPFDAQHRSWWLNLPVSDLEKVNIYSDLETLSFAQQQVNNFEQAMLNLAAQDERIPLLYQLPGVGLITAMTILAAIGDIQRFPEAKCLVGYTGLGARVHDSGLTTRTGRITKAGRKDLRTAMIEAAQTAANTHPHWQTVLARLEPRLGRNKAIVAIARKMLIAVWHILSQQAADRFAQPDLIARKLLKYAYRLGKPRRPQDFSAPAYVRSQLDRLSIAQHLTHVHWGVKKKPIPLPPSRLTTPGPS